MTNRIKLALIMGILAGSLNAFNSAKTELIGRALPVTNYLEVSVGQAKLLDLIDKPERISLSNPGIAYVLMPTPGQLQIIGRNPGRTNLFIWIPAKIENGKEVKAGKVIGAEISVGLPRPPMIRENPTMEILNGNHADMIYLGNPSEKIPNSKPGRVSGPATDMPEPCLSPGCI
ncbi:MAG: pilus assembly protein N-terminal domain-containing protein [Candidatus Caenarcaniphilales bacterium]|nr:pilus assembly protein N-terminal domain-containing protein [Candidatus Caenarcaniphilales bacterium]